MRQSFSIFRRATKAGAAFRSAGLPRIPPARAFPRHFSTADGFGLGGMGPSPGAAPAPDIDAKWKELELLRKSHGSDADETINMMSHVANVLRDTGKLDKAAELYKEAEVELRTKYGDNHPHTYSSVANLGTIYGLMGKVDQVNLNAFIYLFN
jgi:hypothetical protein